MLNRQLYERLRSLYGEVRIARKDDPGFQYETPGYIDPITHRRKFATYSYAGGEFYNVCCPFCNDDNFHLGISYRYGMKDPAGRVIRIANCFHKCMEDEANRKQLEYDILINPNGPRVGSQVITPSEKEPEKLPVRSVNKVISIHRLPENHIAITYLKDRGFDIEALRPFQLGYCCDEEDWMCYDRLIIPIINRGKMVGWQSRAIRGTDRRPKYYTSKNINLGDILYNYDVARHQPYVVLTEGVFDVWSVGPAGVCLFGKALSAGQHRELLSTWVGKPIGVMLDRDAQKEVQSICSRLAKEHRGPVIPIPIPDGYNDPGETPGDVMKQHLKKYFVRAEQ